MSTTYVTPIESISVGDTITYRIGVHVNTRKVTEISKTGTILVEYCQTLSGAVLEMVKAEEVETVWKAR